MSISIRLETTADYRRTEEITREAFWNLHCPGCNEHFILHNMRKHPDFIPALSFVIELDGQIVGSIFYTHSSVISKDGVEYKTITFGPVSILPGLHRKGLGRAIIAHSIKAAKQQGYRAIIIGGYPYHYHTYGFAGTKKYGISLPDGNFYTGIMALPLYEGALKGVSGSVQFSNVFESDESAMEEFDKSFPAKARSVQASQEEFEKAVCEIDYAIY